MHGLGARTVGDRGGRPPDPRASEEAAGFLQVTGLRQGAPRPTGRKLGLATLQTYAFGAVTCRSTGAVTGCPRPDERFRRACLRYAQRKLDGRLLANLDTRWSFWSRRGCGSRTDGLKARAGCELASSVLSTGEW